MLVRHTQLTQLVARLLEKRKKVEDRKSFNSIQGGIETFIIDLYRLKRAKTLKLSMILWNLFRPLSKVIYRDDYDSLEGLLELWV